MEPSATSGSGLRVVETRVYYDTSSGDVLHVHRLAVAPGQEVDDHLRRGVDAFDQWLRSQHDVALGFLRVEESDLPSSGPLRVDVASSSLVVSDAPRAGSDPSSTAPGGSGSAS